jgi:hypothetical protein
MQNKVETNECLREENRIFREFEGREEKRLEIEM